MTKTNARVRRIVKNIMILTMIVIVLLMYVLASYVDTHYKRDAVVIHTANNYYAVAIDNSGNEWEFCAEDICVGDTVVMQMYTNHSDTIYDDEVVGIKIVAGNK
jgi:hypothetical protein